MEPRDRMKESKMALNGRLLLLLIGIMLVFNGITTSGRNGLGWMSLAKSVDELENEPETEAAESGAEAGKTEEAVESSAESEIAEGQGETTAGETGAAPELDLHVLARQMDASGITTGDLRMLGILSLIAMVFEVCVGLLCAVFSNRVDKSKITWIAATETI